MTCTAHSAFLREEFAVEFTVDQLEALSRDYQFYRFTDGTEANLPLAGQFFAIAQAQTPQPSTNDTFLFEAVVPILKQPNSQCRLSTLNDLTINSSIQVRSSNPAKVVAQTHPNLIRYLLAL